MSWVLVVVIVLSYSSVLYKFSRRISILEDKVLFLEKDIKDNYNKKDSE